MLEAQMVLQGLTNCHIGATSTREGLAKSQFSSIHSWLFESSSSIGKLHHGVCIGGDEEINDMARMLDIWTTGHPPTNTMYMSRCIVDEMLEPKDFLNRDRDIVNVSRALLVAPKQNERPKTTRGSGTWYTHDYAVGHEVPTIIFWPDGRIEISGKNIFNN